MAIWVNAIERVLWRRFSSHIFKKRIETVTPSIADRDATAAIMRITDVTDQITALLHSTPRSVFRTSLRMPLAVLSISLSIRCSRFALKASATAGVATGNTVRKDYAFIAAFASETPSVMLYKCDRDQSTVCLAY